MNGAIDLLEWFDREGILPLPCETRSKIPLKQVSSDGVYGWGKAPLGDSYHVASPERLSVIRAWWRNREFHRQVGPTEEAMSIDCDPGFHQGRRVFGVDVDRDDLFDAVMASSELSSCPGVRGKKGVKLFGFIANSSRSDIPGIIQWFDTDPDHPALELFTDGKHMLVYGEHPDSTVSNRIFYQFVRGFGDPFPVLQWETLLSCVERIAEANGLKRSCDVVNPEPTPQERPRDINHVPTRASRLGVRLEDICVPINPEIHGQDVYGENPFHGSSTGKNLHLNMATQRWYCHRCRVGGGVNTWLQIRYVFEQGYKSMTLCRDVMQRVNKV